VGENTTGITIEEEDSAGASSKCKSHEYVSRTCLEPQYLNWWQWRGVQQCHGQPRRNGL